VKEELPRIQYANPALKIEVNKVVEPREDWQPEIVLELQNGSRKTLNMAGKWSTTIFQELMNTAGGAPWTRWKEERQANGLPVVEGAEIADLMERRLGEKRLLDSLSPRRPKKEKGDTEPNPDPFENLRTKTGAAAILP